MGDVDGGDAHLALDVVNHAAHFDAQLGVQVGQRLVHEQHLRVDDDGAGQRHALLLAAGEAFGQTVLILVDVHQGEHFIGTLLHFILGDVAKPEAVLDVFTDGQVGEDGVALEHHADVALVGGHVVDDLVAEGDGAALDGVEARDHAKQRGFAAAGGSEQSEELAVFDVGGQIRDDDVFTEFFDYMVNGNRYAHTSHTSF